MRLKIDIKGVLIALLFLALILTNIIQCNDKKEIPSYNHNNNLLDSLSWVINNLKIEQANRDYIIDSLKNQLPKTVIKYETDIKNFNDVHVISDDSIASYIRKKINSY